MKLYRHRLLSTTYLSLAIGSGAILLAPAVVGGAGAGPGGVAFAAQSVRGQDQLSAPQRL